MSGFTSPSTTNLLSSGGTNDTIAPDIEDDLEAGRGANTGKNSRSSTAANNQLAPPSSSTSGPAGAQGQMNAPQREQSIWEQSACVI